MTPEELMAHLRSMATSRCQQKHPDIYDSLICIGPGSAEGFGPPCDECLDEVNREYQMKLGKAQGQELSAEESAQVRKRLGIE